MHATTGFCSRWRARGGPRALPRIEAIRRHVEACAKAQRFDWGMNVSDTALMTCLVSSETEGLHVHFIDGGGGGYTSAARQLKAARAARG